MSDLFARDEGDSPRKYESIFDNDFGNSPELQYCSYASAAKLAIAERNHALVKARQERANVLRQELACIRTVTKKYSSLDPDDLKQVRSAISQMRNLEDESLFVDVDAARSASEAAASRPRASPAPEWNSVPPRVQIPRASYSPRASLSPVQPRDALFTGNLHQQNCRVRNPAYKDTQSHYRPFFTGYDPHNVPPAPLGPRQQRSREAASSAPSPATTARKKVPRNFVPSCATVKPRASRAK